MICFSSFVVLIIEMELETFKITVLPLRQKMLNFSRRLVEDAADAEDVVQEAFIKLWYIREKLDAYHSVEALAMQVTKNLSLDKIKLRKPQGSELESVTLISEAVSPDEQLEQKDAAECIRRLIAQLPTLQQTIIRMKDIEGYELAEIAEITATPVENVRVNLSRARKKIREQLMLRRIIAFWGDLSLCSRPHFAALRLLYLTLQATVQVAYLIINIIELQFSPCTFLLPIREIFIPFPGFSRYDVPFTNHFLSSFHCFFVGFPCFPLRKCIAIPLFHYATFCFRMSDLLNTSVSGDSSKTVRLVIIVCT